METTTTYDSSTKTWLGPKQIKPDNSFHYKKSLGEHIFEAFSKNGDRIAQISDNNGITLTYSQLLQQSICVAQNLIKIGCTNDDVVVIMMKNGHMVNPIVFGCILAGVPINSWHLTVSIEEMKFLLKTVEPKVIICDDEYADAIKRALIEIDHKTKLLDSVDKMEKLFKETGEQFKPSPKSEKCGFYVLSSGTTGLYKISTFKESFWIDSCLTGYTSDPNTIFFTFQNTGWMGGIYTLLTGAFNGSRRIITNETFSPDLMIKIIEKYKVNIILTTPLMLQSMISSQRFTEANFNYFKCILTSGSILPNSIKTEFKNRHPNVVIDNGYALTEFGGAVSRVNILYERENVVGALLAGVKARIVDSENNRLLGPNEIGTIRVKIDEFGFKEFYRNEKETKMLFDENGFLKTGDVGYFDEEGVLSINGREKDLIRNFKGDIHPILMEELISKHKDVIEVVIVGVVNQSLDNLPAAAIVTREGSSVTEKDILEIVEEGFETPVNLLGGVYFVNQLPRTSTSKIMRYKVKDMLNEMYNQKYRIVDVKK